MIINGDLRGTIVVNFAYLLIGFAVFQISRIFMEEQESREVEENLEDLRSRRASSALVKLARPFLGQYIVPMVRGKSWWDNSRKIYKRKLISAGIRSEMTPDEFISFKFFLSVFFPVAIGFFKIMDLLQPEWYYPILAAVAGYFYPDLWIKGVIARRQKAVLKSLPFVVDLLALSTEAGLDFIGALQKVVEKSVPGPFIDELEQMLKEIRVGSSRAESLREMAIRIDLTEVSSFVAILISADQMGASIGKVLRQQSDQVRSQRFIRAEKMGAQASQKLLLPLVLLILPAVGLMIMGPFIINYLF